MNRIPPVMKFISALLLITLCHAGAEPRKKPGNASNEKITVPTVPMPIETVDATSGGLSPSAQRTSEFQGDEVGLVLRTLGRQAHLNVVISDNVRGTVTMRIEDKTPKESFDIICSSKGLKVTKEKGVYYVSDPKAPTIPAKDGDDKNADPAQSIEETLSGLLTPGVLSMGTKVYDALLDVAARPETAKKIARAKKQLFDALMEEGFTREEALKIVIYSGEAKLPDLGK